MRNKFFETIVGAVILLVAILFMVNVYKTTDIAAENSLNTYNLYAKFNRIDGLNLAADIKIGGIKIGKVIDLELDQKTYQAIVKMRINEKILLSVDTSAEIIGGSLLGDKYISISPGVDDEKLAANQYVQYTQSPILLESLVSKFMFNSAEKAGKDDSATQASSAANATANATSNITANARASTTDK